MDQKTKQLREEIDTSNNFETKYETFVAYMKAAIFKASNKKKIEYKQIMNTINMKPEENSKTVKDRYINNKNQGNNKKGQDNSWWDKECEEVINNRKKCLIRLKKNKDTHSYIEYNKARAIARKIMNKKKRDNFFSFCSSINKSSDIKYVWNKMRIFKNSRKTIEWNKWQFTDRNAVIKETIQELSPSYRNKKWKYKKNSRILRNSLTLDFIMRN